MTEDDLFRVVVNDEEQYSIWPADKPLPAGWTHASPADSKAACLKKIEEVWTDLRPKSVRARQRSGG